MTKKEYLRQYLIAYREAERIGADIARLRMRYALPQAIQYSDMPKAHNVEHDLSDYMAKVDQLERKLSDKLDQCIDIERQIRNDIDRMEDDKERELLRLRYIDGMTWERVAECMNKSDRYVRGKLHGKALQHFIPSGSL